MNPKLSHHLTLKSYHASGGRCLLKHKSLIRAVLEKAARRFGVTVYNHAVAGNHLHVLVKGRSRLGLQNFFRVFAGHTAQQILKLCPLPKPRMGRGSGGGAHDAPLIIDSGRQSCAKNRRKFWGYLIYSRIVSWGREFKTVLRYIDRNTLEALGLIAYEPRETKPIARNKLKPKFTNTC
jgi:REP element-mobilizing transposase RayT